GEIAWMGVEPIGDRDGRVALYLADQLAALAPPLAGSDTPRRGTREAAILAALAERGASFFGPLHDAAGGGYPAETVAALWTLVWQGRITNDTFHALRAFTAARASSRRRGRPTTEPFRSRRLVPPAAEGRWVLVERSGGSQSPSDTAATT